MRSAQRPTFGGGVLSVPSATESGKSKGQFYTPAEVSRIMAQIIGIRDATPPTRRPFMTPLAALVRCC
ncbi:MAG: N-6 DNA methylase [Methanothrix soehngenii]